jgi:hypothetical protein
MRRSKHMGRSAEKTVVNNGKEANMDSPAEKRYALKKRVADKRLNEKVATR